MNEIKLDCECGGTAYLDSYEEDGEKWYFFYCESCGRRNKLDYNYVSLAANAWHAGEVTIDNDFNYVYDMINKIFNGHMN